MGNLVEKQQKPKKTHERIETRLEQVLPLE